ncbi:MAG: hypothetical protein M1814_004319 [Vezdaea aestivalis]|nr:MAG: hypothetical protein M1814_004319 [Vezdaea aestivalis]
MVVKVIYIARHGFRCSFTVNSQTKVYESLTDSPTHIPGDVPLTSHGEHQARELGWHLTTLSPPIDVLYSSPYYRCLQTLSPGVHELEKQRDGKKVEVRGEAGLGEWFGPAPFLHPQPASPETLNGLFPFYSLSYQPICTPPMEGETAEAVHIRVGQVWEQLISDLDQEDSKPQAVFVCTHAATMIASGRVLTGTVPEDLENDDFKAFTACISRFEREDEEVKGGRWKCTLNGDCSFLADGPERGWFSADESFYNSTERPGQCEKHGTMRPTATDKITHSGKGNGSKL